MKPASSDSWKRLPPPALRDDLEFQASFTAEEMAALKQGIVPEAMEDKWFIYFADGWLFFHRSWTGALIYAMRFEDSPGGAQVVESWVNRDPEQHKATDTAYDRKLVRYLIDAFLLERKATFPLPAYGASTPPGVIQHHLVGRGYRESDPES